MRTDAAGDLLLTFYECRQDARVPAEAVLKFDPLNWLLSTTTVDEWNAAPGKVIQCLGITGWIDPFVLDTRDFKLQYRASGFSTFGKRVADARESPDHKNVAVLSTDEYSMPSLFLGRVLNADYWYHEVFTRATGSAVGKVYLLRDERVAQAPRPCWSEDSRFVVYSSGQHRNIWIVPVDCGQKLGK